MRTVSHSASVNTSVFSLACVEELIAAARADARDEDRLALHVKQTIGDESMTTTITVTVSGP